MLARYEFIREQFAENWEGVHLDQNILAPTVRSGNYDAEVLNASFLFTLDVLRRMKGRGFEPTSLS